MIKCDKFDEDKYVKLYMNKYGIDNVRGGSYTKVYLYETEIAVIKRELNSANDECFKCGSKDHYAVDCKTIIYETKKCYRCGRDNHHINNCYAETYIDGKPIHDLSESKDEIEIVLLYCYRCGRNNHFANNCYAATDIDGRKLYK